jgi:hypothetical protein
MKKCAVIIGVNKTGGLPVLSAAVTGAKQFKSWADGQGFETTLLTDEGGGKVTVKEITDAVRSFVDKRTYSQMVVFFSGHGILKSATDEQWLLSDAPVNVNETVNVLGSRMLAKRTGIPHVVFISDACRSIPNDSLVTEVIGSVIFPNIRQNGDTEIDILYATKPGDPSFEVKEDTAVENFKGIYTDCMLKALKGEIAGLIQPTTEDNKPIGAVPVYELNKYLKEAVPDAASLINITLSQTPDGEVVSRLPKYLSKVTLPPVEKKRGSPRPKVTDLMDLILESTNYNDTNLAYINYRTPEPEVGETQEQQDDFQKLDRIIKNAVKENKSIGQSINALINAKGRRSFETRTGFTVIGSYVFTPVLSRGRFEIEDGDNVRHIRIYEEQDPRTMLLILENGNAVPLAILRGFIGTIVIESGQIINVNYFPSEYTNKYSDAQRDNEEMETRRALVATSARLGLFKLDGDINTVIDAASYLRNVKGIDPTMGLYAAYAYAQAGKYDGIRSVYYYMNQEPEPVLYDVYMLNLINADRPEQPRKALAPFCPMLTQGWSYMSIDWDMFPGMFKEIGKYLVPGLWTTFNPKGVEVIKHLITTNQLL